MSLLAGFGDLGLAAQKAAIDAALVTLNNTLATVQGLPTLLNDVEDLQTEIIDLKAKLAAMDAG